MNTARLLLTASSCLVFLAMPSVSGAHSNGESAKDEIEIVLCISEQLIDDLTQDEVEMKLPIRESIDGMLTTGYVTGKGKADVELVALENRSEFLLTISGNAKAKVRVDAGPAVAHMSSTVEFNAQKTIVFDGVAFTHGRAEASTRSSTRINRICPKQSGMIGEIIKSIGRLMAEQAMPEINRAVDDVAERMLAETFDDLAAEVIAELNKTTKFEETVAKYFPETKSWVYKLATTDNYILTGAGPREAKFPELLTTRTDSVTAAIELWIKTRPAEAVFLEMLVDWNIANDLLRDYLPEEEEAQVAEDVTIDRIDGWSVIRVGTEEMGATPE